MSLPPDPHDDDLAEPPTPPPAAAGTGDAPAPPPPPPPPPPAAGPGALPPPSSPAYPQPFEAAPAPTTVPTSPVSDPSGSVTVASPPTGAGTATDGTDATSPLDTGAPPASFGRKSRLGLALAGVVAVIVIAGGVVIATGSSDDDTDEVASESPAGDEAETDAGAGDSEDPSAADDPTASEADSAAPSDESDDPDGDDATVDAPTGEDDPVAAAEEFFEAVSSGDCEGMVSRMSMESFGADGQSPEDAIEECENDAAGTAAASRGRWDDVQLVSIDGDEAKISVTLSVGGQESERVLPMVLDQGTWKMDLDVAAGPGL